MGKTDKTPLVIFEHMKRRPLKRILPRLFCQPSNIFRDLYSARAYGKQAIDSAYNEAFFVHMTGGDLKKLQRVAATD